MFFIQAVNEEIEELCYESYFTFIHGVSISRSDLVDDACIQNFRQTVF